MNRIFETVATENVFAINTKVIKVLRVLSADEMMRKMVVGVRWIMKLVCLEADVGRIEFSMSFEAITTKSLRQTIGGGALRAKVRNKTKPLRFMAASITRWNGNGGMSCLCHFEGVLFGDEFVEELTDKRSVFDAVRMIWFCCEFHSTFGALRKTFPFSVYSPPLV